MWNPVFTTMLHAFTQLPAVQAKAAEQAQELADCRAQLQIKEKQLQAKDSQLQSEHALVVRLQRQVDEVQLCSSHKTCTCRR
jgi:hypothetical protein